MPMVIHYVWAPASSGQCLADGCVLSKLDVGWYQHISTAQKTFDRITGVQVVPKYPKQVQDYAGE